MNTNRDYEKKYYNTSLDEILSKYISEDKYGVLASTLKDIFQRRAYEFDFSDSHIENEVKNFIKKAKEVEFVPEEKLENKSTMGVYIPSKKKIQLNQSYYSRKLRDGEEIENGEKLYETLTHEVYHAISDRVSTGVETYNYAKFEWGGVALNEIITETAANRAVFSRGNREFEKGRNETDGYSDITFVTNLMAASLGVTEKEFLKAGLQNRKELMKLFNSKFPSNSVAKTAKKEYWDKMEASLDMVYNLNYGKRDPDEPPEIRSQLRKSALTTLYKSAYELAKFQIFHDKSHKGIEFSDEVSFRFLKLENILMDSSKYFQDRNYISRQDYREMHDEIYQTRQRLGTDVLKFAGKRSFSEINRYEVYNNSYAKKIMREDFDNRREWNNINVSSRMLRGLRKALGIRTNSGNTEPIPVVDDPDKTEPIPVVDDPNKTEPIPVVDDPDKTEPIQVVGEYATEPLNTVGSGKSHQRITVPVNTEAVRKRITEKGATVANNTKANDKTVLDKFKQTIDIIITRFKNRKLAKLNEAREDKSEYYAGLVSNNNGLKNELDKYKVNVSPLHVENMTVGTEERKDERNQDEER